MKHPCIYLVVMVSLMMSLPVLAENVKVPDLSFSLPAPVSADHRAYLGLNHNRTFTLDQIKADIVILQIFSMYCPICQREASKVNGMYEQVAADPKISQRIRFIGIGTGNSAFEVDFYKKTYQVPFPLFADEDFVIHKQLKEVGTPHFIGLTITPDTPKGYTVFYARSGEVGDPEAFVNRLIDSSGLDF
ncbi:peroxiredoxin family protein [Desulfotignum phosphitoxidans]|uniref:Thiol-disulfide oxidoreductase ResA n=1 Tax=Desulfotignum phosphitoxidans DSM 13687 TaxID=1286635 RepID=S0FZU5_9BACT|nr:redoxin domain-containing protein [Desulfotignum phosphitoxidans]EMS80653.1 thiol-disulfide oxidoreductase ResA [Desulfotignum phosphitoxidans DSM 13687]